MTIIIVSKINHTVNQHSNVASISLYDGTYNITFTDATSITVQAANYYIQLIY